MSKLETIVGLEVHVELLTQTKLFCGCSAAFGADPNTQVCSVCLGLPGETLPLLNQQAVEFAMKTALALNCQVAEEITFDRKNYFYADLPKGYQISQFFQPIGTRGYVEILSDGEPKKIGIHQIHLEEDTGKLLHVGDILSSPFSRVDFNRAGVPLIEIVTEPDIRSAEEARLFLHKLRSILRYLGISDCKMEEGSMRCDANVSVKPRESSTLGKKTELKNMNSFKSVYKGIEYEVERQGRLVEEGGEVIPETRHWDEVQEYTKAMRSKFVSADYRCFPDPNLPPLDTSRDWVEAIRKEIPELPDMRLDRFVQEYGLPLYDAEILTASRELADFYEATLKVFQDPKMVSNWTMGELLSLLNDAGLEIGDCKVTPESLGELLKMVQEEVISRNIGKTVLEEMFASGEKPDAIVEKKGLVQISDEDALSEVVAKVIEQNPKSVEDYHGGKKKAVGFLVGQVMKETGGKANPQMVNEMLKKQLDSQ